MIDAGAIEDGVAPSYFLEGLLYNVPNDNFGSSYEDTFRCRVQLDDSSRPDPVCVRE
jgi:hypothetical protein